MSIFFHGLSWLIAAIAWTFLSFRFWQNFIKTKSKVAESFFYFSVFLIISMLCTAVGQLFFIGNLSILQAGLTLNIFLNTLAFAYFGYLIFYIKFPNISPKIGFLSVFIFGLGAVILNILFPIRPLGETGKLVAFSLHFLTGICYFILIAVPALILGFLLLKEALSFPPSEERTKSLGLGILCILGVLISFLYAIPRPEFISIRPFIMIGWAIGVILLAILTQKPPSPPY
ncbi:MAG: hypothetical protein COX36_02200 [Candidatus Nealsonbacteria bacterium CG23_combo_of_CG06-09_8_20_14_all_38_19]|uniref:Histidine kinase N-terminal 7TM region domain-containing protein n=1 Tax=Candidatus Nealsonbacteria bacterium CG23_combo_of_CG06-09_8_20_14_all_38_19 TaxID=1974721 RepID=A0A2G9YWP9_9BACT|nr:MAG: hypothetical protein COX36_02200 [Candidatus Nealsonbacteria bacterium CG23_combo_of_CG06-09_8_20_14_all_38_19]